MVGTSAIAAFRARRRSSARPSAGMVRAILGWKGIGSRSSEAGGEWKTSVSGADFIKADAVSPSAARLGNAVAVDVLRNRPAPKAVVACRLRAIRHEGRPNSI